MNLAQEDGRSRRASRRRIERREEILRVAQQVIGSRGYQATSIADVIEAAGVSRGTFYLYFESRDALFHELLDRFIKKLIGCIQGVRPEDGGAIEQLYDNVRRVVGLLIENRNLTKILFREAVGLDAQVDKKLNHLNTFLLKMVRSALRNGAEWGLIRDVNEDIVSMAIIGSIKEVLYQQLVVDERREPNADVIAEELLQFGIRGLKPEWANTSR